ncbi:MAG: class I SAM-dependent methyltransferase [Verrucomicrobia bacterium]|nr:class I SAM-dependent methyltransferase [Verrucomicrobiota bacterium]
MVSYSKHIKPFFSPLPRKVEPEILDELSPLDEGAKQSRKDLVLINKIMGHARLLSNALSEVMQKRGPIRIAEMGAGDGILATRIFKTFGQVNAGSTLHFIDRSQTLAKEARQPLERQGWQVVEHVRDFQDWLDESTDLLDACYANLFLHHFDDASLKHLMHPLMRRTRQFVCCEPRRHRMGLLGAAGLRLLGCHDVTLHDAYVSVKAGFRATELSSIWNSGAKEQWILSERSSGLFSHFFKASAP